MVSWKMSDLGRDSTDTFAASHLPATSLAAGAATEKAASLKTSKYENLHTTHLFVPIAIEISGNCFNQTGFEFITCHFSRSACFGLV